jgi:hypothetical protein
MAIDSEAKRNSALLRRCGVLIPDGTVDASDRQTLVGDYGYMGPAPLPPAGGGGAGPATTSADPSLGGAWVFRPVLDESEYLWSR